MADLHILRQHTLGLSAARKIAAQWAAHAEKKFDMRCTYQEGSTRDEMGFARPGVQGTLSITENAFEFNARLGVLLGAFKATIEREISEKLDDLLKSGPSR